MFVTAKTAALGNARQVHKLNRHNQSAEFELQRQLDSIIADWLCVFSYFVHSGHLISRLK